MADNNTQPPDAGQKSSGGLFGSHEKKGPDPEVMQIRNEFNSLSRRLREMEERTQNLRKKVQMTDQNLMSQNKKYRQELKVVNSELNELKHIMNDLDNKMILLIKELRMCARKEDVKVLQRYVDIWKPIEFVTRSEVEKIVKDKVEDATGKRLD